MRKSISLRFALALAVVALQAGQVGAVALFFSSPGPGDVPGVVRVDMWFEDPSRERGVYALQFDLDIVGGILGPEFQFPNTERSDATNELLHFPFDLLQSIEDYPTGPRPNDIRTTVVSSDLLSINGLASSIAAFPDCVGDACMLQELGLIQNRLYLGSFHLEHDAQPVFLKLDPRDIFGEGEWVDPDFDPLIRDLRFAAISAPYCDDPRGCRIEGLVPEPTTLEFIGVALAALSAVRWRIRLGTLDE